LFSATLAEEGWTVVCTADRAPAGSTVEDGWRCLKVEGPMLFTATGILAGLTGPLADAGIPVFAVSTYETDYLLVKQEHLPAAADALRDGGHRVAGDAPPKEAP
jgi:hypothetical protein